MTAETTAGDQTQTPPGDASTTETAKPNTPPVTEPAKVEGQGEGGDKTEQEAAAKSEADKKAADELAAAALNGAPESYEAFQLPEGFVLEGDRLKMANDIAKELNLSQAGAQKLVDAYTQLATADAADLVGKVAGSPELLEPILETARRSDAEKWGTELKTELGDQYEKQANLAQTAVRAVGNPKLLAEFDRLGWGNHPELFKAFAFFGAQLRDSKTDGLQRDANSQGDAPLANRMYPNMK